MTLEQAAAYLAEVQQTEPNCKHCGLALSLSGCFNCVPMSKYKAAMNEATKILGGEKAVAALQEYIQSENNLVQAQAFYTNAKQCAISYFSDASRTDYFSGG